jgi:hypothetical protein
VRLVPGFCEFEISENVEAFVEDVGERPRCERFESGAGSKKGNFFL